MKNDCLPLITIVTVVFNDAKNIESTILNVISQTYPNIEYIIVDGGSKDGTIDILKKYSNKINWISEPDKGIYDAMNKGARIAKGEWILYRNSGDYFYSIYDVANIFNGYDYSDIDIIYGDALTYDQYGYFISKPPRQIGKENVDNMPVFHPSTFVRTSLQRALPFDLRYRLASDHDFFYRCTRLNKIYYYVPVILSIFNIGDGASVRYQHINMMEHYFIHGGKKNSIKFYCNFIKISLSRFRYVLSKIMPVSFMRKRKKVKGWKLWSENYNIDDLLKQPSNF